MSRDALGAIVELVGAIAVVASIDFEYLRLVFEENPGLIRYWDRYRPVGVAVSREYVEAVDEPIREILSMTPNESMKC